MGRAQGSQNVPVLEVQPQLPGLRHPGGMPAVPRGAPGSAPCLCPEGASAAKPLLGAPLMPWVPAVFWTDEVLLSAANPALASGLYRGENGAISGFSKHVSSPQVWAPIADRGAGGTCRPETPLTAWCQQHPCSTPRSLPGWGQLCSPPSPLPARRLLQLDLHLPRSSESL